MSEVRASSCSGSSSRMHGVMVPFACKASAELIKVCATSSVWHINCHHRHDYFSKFQSETALKTSAPSVRYGHLLGIAMPQESKSLCMQTDAGLKSEPKSNHCSISALYPSNPPAIRIETINLRCRVPRRAGSLDAGGTDSARPVLLTRIRSRMVQTESDRRSAVGLASEIPPPRPEWRCSE